MKKTCLLFLSMLVYLLAPAQKDSYTPNITLKWAPTGIILGSLSLQAEYSFGHKQSLTAKIGLPLKKNYEVTYDANKADIAMKAISFLAGYRKYLSKQKLKGLYLEPYFKYAHHTSSGVGNGKLDNEAVVMDFNNEYNAVGIGAQLGAQFFIGKRFVIDLFFFGPEINSATSKFKAVDISNNSAWNTIQSAEAEQDIRNFLNEFPFIRNRVEVSVDRPNRTVKADFKGALPGIRIGFSVGIAL